MRTYSIVYTYLSAKEMTKSLRAINTLTSPKKKNIASPEPISVRSLGDFVPTLHSDMVIPLSENLIIGFFIDMIHDFAESSVFTGCFRTDAEYMIMMFDSVFSGYWPECGYTLRQIVLYLKDTTPKGIAKREEEARKDKLRKKSARKPQKKVVRCNDEAKDVDCGIIGKEEREKMGSAATFIKRAHPFFYTLITRQNLNNGILTFNYNSRTNSGVPVTESNESVIKSLDDVAGGGRGLPSNYFFGGFTDHQVRLQTLLDADVTKGNVYKTYEGARKATNLQSFTDAYIKVINLGSPPDYTDSMGTWERYGISSDPRAYTPKVGGDAGADSGDMASDDDDAGSVASDMASDDGSVATPTSDRSVVSETTSVANASGKTEASQTMCDAGTMSVLDNIGEESISTAKPMFVVEDALKSGTQLPATFSLNNRFVFSVGKNNQFNLVPIKSTAERYDSAAKKLQAPPELYDEGQLARDKVLERIATRQASCYDYFYRTFNLKFGSFAPVDGMVDYGVPIANQDQRQGWKEYVNLSIGPNKFYFKDSANLTSKIAVGTDLLFQMSDEDFLNKKKRNEWAKGYVKYLLNNTEDVSKVYGKSLPFQDAKEPDTSAILQSFIDDLTKQKATHVSSLKDKLPIQYLYNFSYFDGMKPDKSFADKFKDMVGFSFTALDEHYLFPSYFEQKWPIANMRKERQSLIVQFTDVVSEWVQSRMNEYQVSRNQLMTKLRDILVSGSFVNQSREDAINVNSLYDNFEEFRSFLLFKQGRKPTVNKERYDYALLMWDDILDYNTDDRRVDQLNMSISLILALVTNIRLVELCLRQISKDVGMSVERSPASARDVINAKVWVPSLEIYLTDVVLVGCSNGSNIVINNSGTQEPNEDIVTVPVAGDDEGTVKGSGSSVAAVLHSWRMDLITNVLGPVQEPEPPVAPKRKKPRRGGRKPTKAEQAFRSALEQHSQDASGGRKEGIDEQLKVWLQCLVLREFNTEAEDRGPGFTPNDLRRSFGLLFQKTAGDFFQVKLTQYLNDTSNCFTCDKNKCPVDDKQGYLYDRSVYRPYAENPVPPKGLPANAIEKAFYGTKSFFRPLVASPVQLLTFDIMAGLIGLQQTVNVALQTQEKTTISNGGMLYGISNLGSPVREYIEHKLDCLMKPTKQDGDEADGDEDNGEADGDGASGEADGDKAGADEKEKSQDGDDEEVQGPGVKVTLHKIPKVEVDIDLISVLRRVPFIITNVRALTSFLFDNDIVGSNLRDIIDLSYGDFVLRYDTTAEHEKFIWVASVRLLFDYMCYYQEFRAEESLARAKAATYILFLAYSKTRNQLMDDSAFKKSHIYNLTNGIAKAMRSSKSQERTSLATPQEGERPGASPLLSRHTSDVVMSPFFSRAFSMSLGAIDEDDSADPYVKECLSEVVNLLQKAAFDKQISRADEVADSEPDTKYTKYTTELLKLFEKVSDQDEEMEATEARVSAVIASSEEPPSGTTGAEEAMEGAVVEEDEAEEADEDGDPKSLMGKRKRPWAGGKRTRGRKDKDKGTGKGNNKRRTRRSNRSSKGGATGQEGGKTLTQILRELSLGM